MKKIFFTSLFVVGSFGLASATGIPESSAPADQSAFAKEFWSSISLVEDNIRDKDYRKAHVTIKSLRKKAKLQAGEPNNYIAVLLTLRGEILRLENSGSAAVRNTLRKWPENADPALGKYEALARLNSLEGDVDKSTASLSKAYDLVAALPDGDYVKRRVSAATLNKCLDIQKLPIWDRTITRNNLSNACSNLESQVDLTYNWQISRDFLQKNRWYLGDEGFVLVDLTVTHNADGVQRIEANLVESFPVGQLAEFASKKIQSNDVIRNQISQQLETSGKARIYIDYVINQSIPTIPTPRANDLR